MNRTAKDIIDDVLSNYDVSRTYLIDLMEEACVEYAKQKCKEQREICYNQWQHMPEWDGDAVIELRQRAEKNIKNAPEPDFE